MQGQRIPEEYIAMDIGFEASFVAELIPTTKLPGLCALVLLHKLVAIQNTFLEEYHTEILQEE